MKVYFLALPFLMAFQSPLQTPSSHAIPAKPTSKIEDKLIADIRARAHAYAAGECQSWATYVSGDFQFIDQAGQIFTRDQEIKECQPRQNSTNRRNLSDFHSQVNRTLAFVHYRYDEIQHWGETEIIQSFRHLDTFELRQGNWVCVYAMQVQIFGDPAIFKVDPSVYDRYAGRYELGRGTVDTVIRKGDTLFIKAPDDDVPTQLFPESADTFFMPGSPTRLTFVTGRNEEVVELIAHYPQRVVFREKKLK